MDKSDFFGVTPLHVAAASGHVECVKLLVEAGANIGAVDRSFGYTPIHSATLTSKKEALEFLLQKATAEQVSILEWLCWHYGI
jgi:ankyrin repeat protein